MCFVYIKMEESHIALYVLAVVFLYFVFFGVTCVETMVAGPKKAAQKRKPKKTLVIRKKAPVRRGQPPKSQPPKGLPPKGRHGPSPLLSPSANGPVDMKGIHGAGQKKKQNQLKGAPVRR